MVLGPANTVSTKLVLALVVPSLTERVIVEAPSASVAGVIVTVRLESVPPNTMLLVGTRAGLEEPPIKVSAPAGKFAAQIMIGRHNAKLFFITVSTQEKKCILRGSERTRVHEQSAQQA